MNFIDAAYRWALDFLNNRVNTFFALVSLLTSYYTFFRFLYRGSKIHLHTIKGIVLLSVILLLGIIIPLLILKTASWSGFGNVILNISAIAGIIFLFFLLSIIYQMKSFFSIDKEKLNNTEQAMIRLRTTHQFFGGLLHIHLTDQEWIGNPLGHKISAKVWSPGFKASEIRRKETGDSIDYYSDHKYDIRIVGASINEAKCEVIQRT